MRAELDALTNRVPVDVKRDNGTTDRVWVKSLLAQLAEAVQGTEPNRGGASGGKPDSKPPIDIDVIQMNLDIRDAIRDESTMLLMHTTGDHALDLQRIERNLLSDSRRAIWSARLKEWEKRIRKLSGEEQPKTVALQIQCPSCGESWIPTLQGDELVWNRAVYATMMHGKVQSFSCSGCGDDAGRLNTMIDAMLAALV